MMKTKKKLKKLKNQSARKAKKTGLPRNPSRMRKKPDGHENLGAGVEISGLSGELAVESGWLRRFSD